MTTPSEDMAEVFLTFNKKYQNTMIIFLIKKLNL